MAKKKKPAESDSAEDVTFEHSLEKLEQIVHQLEDGGLGLSQSLTQYEEGVKHLKKCYDELRSAERKIELLADIDADGNAISEPFDDPSLSLDEKQQTRGRRRSKSPSRPGNARSNEGDVDVDESGGLF